MYIYIHIYICRQSWAKCKSEITLDLSGGKYPEDMATFLKRRRKYLELMATFPELYHEIVYKMNGNSPEIYGEMSEIK